MVSIQTVLGFTGSVWEEPDIDSISIEDLLSSYTNILFTKLDGDKYYLGWKDDIVRNIPGMIARSVLDATPISIELVDDIKLVSSEYRLVTDGVEKYDTVTLPSKERIIINGGSFIPTSINGSNVFATALATNMSRHGDPIIGSMDIFKDVQLTDISYDGLAENYNTSLILLGGILYDPRKFFDIVGNTTTIRKDISGWLPTLYKQISAETNPYECGLSWPIDINDLKGPETFDRILNLIDSRLVIFDTLEPIELVSRRIPKLFPKLIKGVVTYDGRPSPYRVTKLSGINKAPTRNDLYPHLEDINDIGGSMVYINHTVQDIEPRELLINFVDYEVK